jgi:hypothetical protein
MKADEDVKMISAEAPVLFAKACEMFIIELTHRSYFHTIENKRKTLQRSDIAQTIACTDIYDFLQDIIPKEELREAQASNQKALEEQNSKFPSGSTMPQTVAPPDIHAGGINIENTPQVRPEDTDILMIASSEKTAKEEKQKLNAPSSALKRIAETDPSNLNQNDLKNNDEEQ